jgi:triosephosphate isomerase
VAGPRVPIVAGNWKMNTVDETAVQLIDAIKAAGIDTIVGVEKVICPPFPYLALAASLTRGTSIRIGAQDMHWEEKGAFTGEVSPLMVRDYASYVIIGHSERRAYFGETDETVNKKLRSAIEHDLLPIVCVGETGAERQAGETMNVLRRQIRGALDGVVLRGRPVIAYEPVWAIGTGVAASPADANEAIGFIREEMSQMLDSETASAIRILYGGSVNANNIGDFVDQPEVDGGLVGGASLDAAAFVEMVRTVALV